MLETIREFATDELASRGETEHYRDRHADWLIELAKVGGWNLKSNEASIWIDRLVSNRDNLRAAMNWLNLSGQSDRFLNMATYLATFWDYRGELSEGRFWLERAFARINPGAAPTESLARAKTWFGWFQLRQDQLDAAHATLSEALPLWIAVDKKGGKACAHTLLGAIDKIRGNYAEARRNSEFALALFTEVNEIPGGIEALLNLSDLDYQIGNSSAALETALLALERSESEEIQTYIAVSQIAVAQAETACGDARGALEAARTGLMVARDLGFTACAADSLICFAATAASLNKLEPASTLLGAAEAWLKSTGGARFFYHHQFLRTMETVRQGLGPTRSQRGWETGQTLQTTKSLHLSLQSTLTEVNPSVRSRN